jgi:cysteine desulfurase family protein (TIGR01976 family)
MAEFKFNVDHVREQFPCLAKTVNGFPAVFLDGPGGTQTPRRVVDKIADYLFFHNANSHGAYQTSRESDELYWNAKKTCADFLNCSPEEVAFGANTSSNNFRFALGLMRKFLKSGDEVLITDNDHEGNRSPWRVLEDFGVIVKSVKIDVDTFMLDYDDFRDKLSGKTKVLAINWASNATGAVTDVKKYIADAHEVGAITVVDAVHYAPHKVIDVKDVDTDVLLCSSYKFFGPHFGILYVRKELGDRIDTIRVMADDNTEMPWKLETGTPAMEAACGAAEAIEFIADIGKEHALYFEDKLSGLSGRRKNIVAGMLAIDAYEEPMAKRLRSSLSAIEGIRIYGPAEGVNRTSTVSFTLDGVSPNKLAIHLNDRGIFVWDGDFYAVEIINNVLGLGKSGGLVRIGFAPYNLENDVDRVIAAVKERV